MLYNAENLVISIDNHDIACVNSSIEFGNSLDIDRTVYDNLSYVAVNGGVGSLSLSYYVTGSDFLYNKIKDQLETPISGNFAGLYFTSGYLTSHSVNIINNNLVVATCQIAFYDELRGEIQTGISNLGQFTIGHAAKSFSDNSFGVSNTLEFSLSNSIRYSVDFSAHSHIPRSVRQNTIETSFSIQGPDIGDFVYWTGSSGVAGLNIGDSQGNVLQVYGITGQTTKKNVEVNGEFLAGSVNIIQVR